MRALRIAVSCAIALLLPTLALAQTSSSNPQLSALLAQITALEQQIASLSGTSTSSAPALTVTPVVVNTPPTQTGTGEECPVLNENLSVGSIGSDVANLQGFLASQGFFSASVTGYFGPVTESAVETWQSSKGIVSNGSPATTGYGAVGPKTRATIASMCPGQSLSNAPQTSCTPLEPPTTECSTGWQAVLDAAGCGIYYQCEILLPVATTTAGGVATSSAPEVCPVVPRPQCTGQVVPFQNNNGCITSYECVL